MIALAPVTRGDVLEHRLAPVAVARRLDRARTATMPRSLLTTSVARASDSTSSAMIRSGRFALLTASSSGRSFWTLEILSS